jgi:hypothetical protein
MELIISNRWTTMLVNGLDLPRQVGSFGHDGWMRYEKIYNKQKVDKGK